MDRLEIKLALKNLTLLSIAGGSTIGSTDIPLNAFIIPASSLKGAMRTAVHNLLPPGYTSCGEIEPGRIKRAHAEGPCDVCKLFGYPDSKELPCFIVKPEKINNVNVTTITRVAIDDKTQKAEDGSLFTQEGIVPGQEFNFVISYDLSCGERLLKLLLYSILALRYWRLGRNAMVDVKISNTEEIKRAVKDREIYAIIDQLSNYLWGERI